MNDRVTMDSGFPIRPAERPPSEPAGSTDGRLVALADTVHYVSYGTPKGEYESTCRAATVAEVGQWVVVEAERQPPRGDVPARLVQVSEWFADACALAVLNPTGLFYNTVQYRRIDSGPPVAGTWHHGFECR